MAAIFAVGKKKGHAAEEVKAWVKRRLNKQVEDLTTSEASPLIGDLEALYAQHAAGSEHAAPSRTSGNSRYSTIFYTITDPTLHSRPPDVGGGAGIHRRVSVGCLPLGALRG
jgi:hypothetical protein